MDIGTGEEEAAEWAACARRCEGLGVDEGSMLYRGEEEGKRRIMAGELSALAARTVAVMPERV